MTSSVSESNENDVSDGEVRHRTGLPVDRVVFAVAAALAVAFVLWGLIAPEKMGDLTGKAMSWVTGSFGWLFILLVGHSCCSPPTWRSAGTATSNWAPMTLCRSSPSSPGCR